MRAAACGGVLSTHFLPNWSPSVRSLRRLLCTQQKLQQVPSRSVVGGGACGGGRHNVVDVGCLDFRYVSSVAETASAKARVAGRPFPLRFVVLVEIGGDTILAEHPV